MATSIISRTKAIADAPTGDARLLHQETHEAMYEETLRDPAPITWARISRANVQDLSLENGVLLYQP